MIKSSRTPQKIAEGIYFVPGDTNVGIITSENNGITELYLVDSGNSSIDGDFIFGVIDDFFKSQNINYKIKAIITTHGHPDHFGGHYAIQKKSGCEIWANRLDQYSLENPIIHSTVIWGGFPPRELRTSYLIPETTYVDRFIKEGDIIPISGDRTISFTDVHGHTFASLGIIITNKNNEKIIFTGDSIFTREELGKFWIPFILNPNDFLKSVKKLTKIENVICMIPSHGNIIKDNIEETAEFNEISVLSAKKSILDALSQKKLSTIDEITKYVADKNEYKMSLGQYVLMNTTMKSYLAVMHDDKQVNFKVIDNNLYFYKA